jgi:hypothetical protein
MSAACFTGCGKKKSDKTADQQINVVDETQETVGKVGETGGQGAVPESMVGWPDRGGEMQDVIDAVICAQTDHPDITYDYTDSTSFWTYTYYVMCETGETGGLATPSETEPGTYTMPPSLVKVFARAVFDEYNGEGDLPEIPESLDGISYDKENDLYKYKDTGCVLHKSEVYTCKETEPQVYSTVSYYTDGEGENLSITPWKVYLSNKNVAPNSLYPYAITGVEKVDEQAYQDAVNSADGAEEDTAGESVAESESET